MRTDNRSFVRHEGYLGMHGEVPALWAERVKDKRTTERDADLADFGYDCWSGDDDSEYNWIKREIECWAGAVAIVVCVLVLLWGWGSGQ